APSGRLPDPARVDRDPVWTRACERSPVEHTDGSQAARSGGLSIRSDGARAGVACDAHALGDFRGAARKENAEARAAAFTVFDPRAPAVAVGEARDERQADADSRCVLRNARL